MSRQRDLLARHGATLHRYARALAGDPDLARDLWQEAAARALAARPPRGTEAEARVWLFRILRNAFLDATRHARVAREHRAAEEALAGQEWRRSEPALAQVAVAQALARLPDPQREVVALVDLAGFTYLEVADTLGLPRGTVMSRLARGRAAMLAELSGSSVVVPLQRKSV
ncbi:RNA polymerase sigma factor [Pseudoroseomonas globiformis]|uniref:RNA polymerase sigma factor n=1 Tax=Teichococcus globiformis TaxID=2307229 RepID=A0ABV7FYP4_9PROT